MSMRSSCTPSFRGGNVLQINRSAVALADDELVVLLGGAQLALRLQAESAMRAIELAGAGVARAILDRVGQIFECDVADGHGGGIRFDAHCRLRAKHGNLADSRQNADAFADLRAGVIVELAFGGRVADERDIMIG